jgi:2-polyprenyl-3-methyl-5-hydroxy-6-metoxy-1,4-benzoquinol methylase
MPATSVPSTCLACGGTSIATALVKDVFEIRRCQTCGLGRTVVDSTFNPAEYYRESYFQGGAADGYADYLGTADVLRMEFRHIVRQVLPYCRGGRLLEFGCAYGFFLDEAAPHFDSVHGIEFADAAARAGRDRGLDVKTGVVGEETLDGVYDTVVGLDVIEHLPEPQDAVRALAAHMPAGATLIMTTGDWASWLARLMGRRWRLMTPPQHLSFFTPHAMASMLASAGFEVISLTHPWKQVPLSLVAYQLQRMSGLAPRRIGALNHLLVPLNLWDAMRVIARKVG